MRLKIGKCRCDKKISDSSADGQNVAHLGLGDAMLSLEYVHHGEMILSDVTRLKRKDNTDTYSAEDNETAR